MDKAGFGYESVSEGEEEDDILDVFSEILEDARNLSFDNEDDIESFEKRYHGKFDLEIQPYGSLLHMIVTHLRPFSQKFIKWILQKWPGLIKRVDSDSKTPLHIALRRNKPSAIAFVQLVLEHSPSSILKDALEQSDYTNANCLHVAIAGEFRYTIQLIQKCSMAAFVQMNSEGDTPLHIAVSLISAPQKLSRRKLPTSRTDPEEPLAKDTGNSLSAIETELPVAASRDIFYLPVIVQSLMSFNKEALLKKNLHGQNPYQYCLDLLEKIALRDDKPSVEGDLIAQDMKLFCLRNVTREEAMDILYAKGKALEKQIEFDLSGSPSAFISELNLQRLSKHLRFENILQYVALPKLKVEQRDQKLPSFSSGIEGKDRSDPPDRLGLIDAVTIFKWLRSQGVRKIIKVIVVDDGEIPHSDQAVEECLEGFDVEILDWKKLDICSKPICRAARDVRNIYLYSTGSNAVLMSWSGERGLVQLGKLEVVNLIIRRGFETEVRREEELSEFQHDFTMSWAKRYSRQPPKVRVIRDDAPKSYASGFQVHGAEEKQQWFEHMDKFAAYIESILVGRDESWQDITVAVIDDGIDGLRDDLAGSIASGISFCRLPETDNMMLPYYTSSSGHGTIMSSLIRRICPQVKLFIARLEEYTSSDGSRHITVQSAAKAVRWAITRHVHIICIGWTIEVSTNEGDIKDLHAAIEDAHHKNIIVLCAFSDTGRNSSRDVQVPSCWQSTWTIGAANATGDPCSWVDRRKVDFLFPGERIIVEKKPEKTAKPESGSSIATALAAGTAASLLFIAQLADAAIYHKLRMPDRMQSAFRELCKGTDYNQYPMVQRFFTLDSGDLAWNREVGEGGRKALELILHKLLPRERDFM